MVLLLVELLISVFFNQVLGVQPRNVGHLLRGWAMGICVLGWDWISLGNHVGSTEVALGVLAVL